MDGTNNNSFSGGWDIDAIQWTQGAGSPPASDPGWIEHYLKIQAAGKSVVVDLQPGELDEFMSEVAPDGIMLWTPAEPAAQRDVLEKVKTW